MAVRTVHPGITCDLCDACPLTGDRYKCGNCADFDICAECEQRLRANPSLHPANHVFLKIVEPLAVTPTTRPLLPNLYARATSPPARPHKMPGRIATSPVGRPVRMPGKHKAPTVRPPASAAPVALRPFDTQLSTAANAFSGELVRALCDQCGNTGTGANLFCSPASFFMALTMTANGAMNETLSQMATTLHIEPTQLPQINEAARDFFEQLQAASAANGVECSMANSIWTAAQYEARIRPEFRQALQRHFDTDTFALPGAVGPVNAWIESKTNGKIQDMLDKIDPLTIMLLINAVYFRGDWKTKFEKRLTRPGAFHSFGETKEVPMMSREGKMKHLSAPQFQACALEYGTHGAFEAVIVLPNEPNGIDELVARLPEVLSQVSRRMPESKGTLLLPRFKVTWGTQECNTALQSLGMVLPFSDSQADFNGMMPCEPNETIYIGRVLHKAFVEVNESGTEAAAATIVEMRLRCACFRPQGDRPWVMRCDHPFLFLIRMNGVVLFVGRIASV